jgi:hypothetical protein
MKRALMAAMLFAAGAASAEDAQPPGRRAAHPDRPEWEFALTAYPTQPRGGDTTTSAIAAADRGPLHLEGRYGYEAKDARSAFAGWTFSGGDQLAWELTPIVGGGWGPLHAFIPGFEASLAWGRFDVYTEAELVRDRDTHENDYNYSWNELGFKAMEHVRLGLAGQRTRSYGVDREFQRGPFVQLSWKRATLGAFWFNPGSHEQVFVGAIGVAF